jgi:alanyl-tRNA synthetase
LQQLLHEKQELSKKIESLYQEKAAQLKMTLIENIREVGEYQLLFYLGDFPDADTLKQISFQLKQEFSGLVCIIGTESNGKALLSVMLGDNVQNNKAIDASQLIRQIARHIKGGGGGQPFYATAGGKDPSGLQEALTEAKQIVESSLNLKTA